MAKVIRPTYPPHISIGILLMIFALSFFMSFQLFEKPGYDLNDRQNVYIGAFLVSTAVIIMVLVLWEEFLFPLKIKPTGQGVEFRNHRNKLRNQLLIYCLIPIIVVYVYLNFEVNLLRFIIWSVVIVVTPVVGKLISGINNYNDFLKLNKTSIEYKNNELEGTYDISTLSAIVLLKDDGRIAHKIRLQGIDGSNVMIDLDEMELDDYLNSIEKHCNAYYKSLIKEEHI